MQKLSKEEMKKVIGGVSQSVCFECSSAEGTVDTFYCDTAQDCADQAEEVCVGYTNCSCNRG